MIPVWILCSINIQRTVTIQDIEMYWVTTLFIIVSQLDEPRTLESSVNSRYIWNVKVVLFGLLPICHLFESQRLLLSKSCHRSWQLYRPKSKHMNKILQNDYLIVNKRKQGHPDENLAKISLNTDESFKRAWTHVISGWICQILRLGKHNIITATTIIMALSVLLARCLIKPFG